MAQGPGHMEAKGIVMGCCPQRLPSQMYWRVPWAYVSKLCR